MWRITVIAIMMSCLLGVAYFLTPGKSGPGGASNTPESPETYHRIISIAPSFTEILFELGEGDRIVGVSKFAKWPEAVLSLPRVGGFVDPNYEAIVALAPDLVVASSYNADVVDHLTELGIRCVAMPHDTLPEIYASIIHLGAVCEKPERASELVQHLRERLAATRSLTADLPKRRTLVVVGREGEPGTLGQVYASGTEGYLDTFLDAAGGLNVLSDSPINYPTLNAESVLRLDPDVIIEIVGKDVPPAEALADAQAAWQSVPEVAAVRNNEIHVLTGTVTTIPGPRMLVVLDGMAMALHPEIFPGGA